MISYQVETQINKTFYIHKFLMKSRTRSNAEKGLFSSALKKAQRSLILNNGSQGGNE